MTSLGDTLRGERLRRGLDLDQLAAETKIGRHLLEAMEDEQFDRLPAGAYKRKFLRQYAHSLGLDEDETVAAFRQQYDEPPVALPKPPVQRRYSYVWLVWVVVMIATSTGIYRLLQDGKLASFHMQASVASKPPLTPPSAPPPKPDASQAAVAPSVPATPAADVRAVRVAFTAIEPVWVSVTCDGTQTFAGTIEGPQSKEFDASNKMTVLVGNAGGLALSLNGKPVGPIGARGEIQLLEVTPSGARVVPRRPAPPTTSEDFAAPRSPVTKTQISAPGPPF
jgi:cytoskeletal protein RodZ